VTGAEALLRWNHPRDGLRRRPSFIPIAEQTGVIADIGDWVMAEVASRCWPAGTARASPAAARLQRQPAPARARRLLPPAAADLRRCRRAAVADRARVHRKRGDGMSASGARRDRALARADGATIAIDDFGTGYSNIARLRSMPIDRVKLDPSLIADIETASRRGSSCRR
jgi:EAL domain-containing protein (putative c-di-GMP-specific phosphodiesterase class I)